MWTNRFVERLKQLPELEDVATDQQTGGLAVSLMIDRVTASRLGIAPYTIDNTLYDAYGQRQINTMYTQLNQYHVILEALPDFQKDPSKLSSLYIQSNASSGASGAGASTSFTSSSSVSAGSNATTATAAYTPSSGTLTAPLNALSPTSSDLECRQQLHHVECRAAQRLYPVSAASTRPLSISHQGQFPSVTISFNLAPNASLGNAISAVDKVQKEMNMPASLQAGFQGTAASFKNSLSNEAAAHPRRAGYRLYRARRALRELHSPDHDSLHAALRRRRRAARTSSFP